MGIGVKIAEAFVRLTADRTQLTADLSAAKGLTVAAGEQIAKDFKAKAKLEMPNGAGPAIAQVAASVSVLDTRLANAQTSAKKLEEQIASGSPRMITGQARLAASLELVRMEMERIRTAGGTLTSEQVRQFATLSAAVAAHAVEVRELRKVQTLARGSVQEAGIAYMGFERSLALAAGSYGPLIARTGIFLFAIKEIYKTLKTLGEFSGIDYSHEHDLLSVIGQHAKAAAQSIGDVELFLLRLQGIALGIGAGNPALAGSLFSSITGDASQPAESARRYGLFAPIKRWQGIAGPSKPPADDLDKAKTATDALNRSQQERILQLALENAKLSENEGAMRRVLAAQDQLLAENLRAQGFDEDRIRQIVSMTKANRDLAESMKLKNEVDEAVQKATGTALKSIRDSINDEFGGLGADAQAGIAGLLFPPVEKYQQLSAQMTKALVNAMRQAHTSVLEEAQRQAAEEEQVRNNEALKALNHQDITRAQYDRLIVQSHDLMLAQLRAADEQYATDYVHILARIVTQFGTTGQQIDQLARTAVAQIEGDFSSGLFDAITGNIKGVKDEFRKMLSQMLQDVINFIARREIQQLLTLFLGGMQSSAWGTAAGTSLGGVIGGIIGGANGGVFAGGFRPLASGGVVTSPTLGLVGEGRYNEAVIPLPDGRHVEAKILGGQRDTVVTVNLTHDFVAALRPAMQPTQDEIVMQVGADFLRNGVLRQIIRSQQ